MADLYDLSDEELEEAFRNAREEEESADEPDGTDEIELDDESIQQEDNEDIEVEDTDDEDDTADDMEQPDEDEDSDNDASTDDDVDDEDSDDSDSEDSNLDGDTDEEDEQTEEDTEDTKEDVQPVKETYKFKANGRDYEFTEEEMKSNYGKLFGQAMDYTKKMQTIKPYRKMIDAWEQEKLTQEDLNLAIDVLKGNKDALGEVIKRAGVDALELSDDEEKTYVPKDYGRDDKALDLDDVIKDISSDKEFGITQKVLGSEWDEASYNTMIDNPNMVKLLHADVKSGMYDTLMPTVDKLKMYDGGSKTDLEYYEMAAKMYKADMETSQKIQEEQARVTAEAEKAEANRVAAQEKEKAKKVANKQAASKRKAATTTRKAMPQTKVGDLLDEISDEDYDEWYSKVQDRM